ncbi:exopolyphosphatase/guanosine-5'-triphosphate,3'-diphosphate pyrophosphatase [Pedobacter sp. UYP30]|uniref:Ppx/GppA phosphatase family protein n=1 Tax=Pedobacter sp. UYP30 TaxID=1756400 RepID=UPI0033969E28
MTRYGAIDVGSNAVRLLIADIVDNGNDLKYKKNTFIRVPVRLGEDSFVYKKILDGKATALIKTMVAFKNLMDVYQVSDYLACATSAMREAENGEELIKSIEEISGIKLEIIGGEREADIIYANHIEQELDQNKQYLYIDVGGGSTELSVFVNGNFGASKSFDIGTIRLLDGNVKKETWEQMKNWVAYHCKNFKQLNAIGTGGNINKLFRLSNGKENSPLSVKRLTEIYDELSSLSLEQRIDKMGLNADRADVIVPAGEIYLKLMNWEKIKKIYVPQVGLADGIIKLLMEKNNPRT